MAQKSLTALRQIDQQKLDLVAEFQNNSKEKPRRAKAERTKERSHMKVPKWLREMDANRWFKESLLRVVSIKSTANALEAIAVLGGGAFILSLLVGASLDPGTITTEMSYIIGSAIWIAIYIWLIRNSGPSGSSVDRASLFQTTVFLGVGFGLTFGVKAFTNAVLQCWGYSNWANTTYLCLCWWTWVPFYAVRLYKRSWIWTTSGTITLMGDKPFTRDNLPTNDAERTNPFLIPDSVREIGSGLRGRWWGEHRLFGINLQALEVCNKTLRLQDANKKFWVVKYQFRRGGLPGYVYNLYRRGVQAGDSFFEAELDAFIQTIFATCDGEVVRAKLTEYSGDFSKIFDGDGNIHIDEKINGQQIWRIRIMEVSRPEDVEDSFNKLVIAENLAAGVQMLVDEGVPAGAAIASLGGKSEQINIETSSGGGGGGKRGKGKRTGGGGKLPLAIGVS